MTKQPAAGKLKHTDRSLCKLVVQETSQLLVRLRQPFTGFLQGHLSKIHTSMVMRGALVPV